MTERKKVQCTKKGKIKILKKGKKKKKTGERRGGDRQSEIKNCENKREKERSGY